MGKLDQEAVFRPSNSLWGGTKDWLKMAKYYTTYNYYCEHTKYWLKSQKDNRWPILTSDLWILTALKLPKYI